MTLEEIKGRLKKKYYRKYSDLQEYYVGLDLDQVFKDIEFLISYIEELENKYVLD